jgi:hypothetical protein
MSKTTVCCRVVVSLAQGSGFSNSQHINLGRRDPILALTPYPADSNCTWTQQPKDMPPIANTRSEHRRGLSTTYISYVTRRYGQSVNQNRFGTVYAVLKLL